MRLVPYPLARFIQTSIPALLLVLSGVAVFGAAHPLDEKLLQAAYSGDPDAVKALVDEGAGVDARDGGGNTPLMLASRGGSAGAVAVLLEAGANPDAVNGDGETALMLSRRKGRGEIAEMLERAGARELFFVRVDFTECELPPPSRNSLNVQSAFDSYTPADWVVSPGEEPEGDIAAGTTPPECDLEGALSCHDEEYLRVDLLLHHPVSSDRSAGFGVRFLYEDGISEYFTYYPGLGRLYYAREEQGRVTRSHRLWSRRLAGPESNDLGGASGRNVYIAVFKDDHFLGDRGKVYHLRTAFYSLTLDRWMAGHLEDRTIWVDLRYVR